MPQDYAASIQGVAIRVTRLDAQGNLLNGPSDSYTTGAFIRTSFTPEYEEGDETTEKAADGTVCVSYKAPDTLKRVNMEIAICEPDPELSALLSGGLMLSGGLNGKEQVLGWASAQVGEDPSGNGVAVEVWSRAIQNGKPAGINPYFRWVFPYVKTRLTGDRVIENGLLATTFEGDGLGNINFRSGIDQSWKWPAATDRPYLYARDRWAPTGLRGFYTWAPALPPGADGAIHDPRETAAPDDLNISGVGGVAGDPYTGTNTEGSGNPYPYNSGLNSDMVLADNDFLATISGTAATYPASAAAQDVANVAPVNARTAQNSVTYLARNGGVSSHTSAPAGGKLTAAVASPGMTFTVPNSDPLQAADLVKLGYEVDPKKPQRWSNGDSITIVTIPKVPDGQVAVSTVKTEYFWDGTAWADGKAPLRARDATPGVPGAFVPVPPVDKADLDKLQADGVLHETNAWVNGQYAPLADKSTVWWDGTAWQVGRAPVKPGAQIPAITGVDADNPPSHDVHTGLVPLPQTAWTAGQKITIGTVDFYWNGTKWADRLDVGADPANTAAAHAAAIADLATLKVDGTLGDGHYTGAAFTAGQYIVLADGSKAHYTANAWAAGAMP